MKQLINLFDIIVVGGGHAGAEAALIAAKRGKTIALVTLDTTTVGRMSCNPAIGGLAKGQIVRELDVLGGVMGHTADRAGTQFKLLNRSKGKSVWSPRAQVDKRHYEKIVSGNVFSHENITVLSGEVVDVVVIKNTVSGAVLRDGTKIPCKAIVLTCGTFLNGLIHIGQKKIRAGRMGESGAEGITESLVSHGFFSGRLKTGTPPRLDKNSVDWSKTTITLGDQNPTPFSYQTITFAPPNVPCFTVKTGIRCKDIISKNLLQSPMYSGDVGGVGPRYCPSIEDKVHRFSHHDSHTLFLEPEWADSDQIYLNGFSTSLPEHVQLMALRTVGGLENVRFFRPGYAIEYDFFSPAQLKSSLETKDIAGLFFAGQINGTSGYEEAAAQGLIAGINASQYIDNSEPLALSRDEAYIGVMIDDLITKDTLEPYRMFTSRAEYRILLRFSNAHSRLLKKSKKFSLLNGSQFDRIQTAIDGVSAVLGALDKSISPNQINTRLKSLGETLLKHAAPAKTVLRRPSVSIDHLPNFLFSDLNKHHKSSPLYGESFIEAEARVKYVGYIKRQRNQVIKMQGQENRPIPRNFNFKNINSLSNEAREKLSLVRPQTLGQAMRVSGVTPADISVLAVVLSAI